VESSAGELAGIRVDRLFLQILQGAGLQSILRLRALRGIGDLGDGIDERPNVLIGRTHDLGLDEVLCGLALAKFPECAQGFLCRRIIQHAETFCRNLARAGKSILSRAPEYVLINRIDDLPAPEDTRLLIDE